MQVTVQTIRKWFDQFNKELWNGKLITPRFIVNYNKFEWGCCACKLKETRNAPPTTYGHVIRISNFWDTPEEVKKGTLVHEMVHLYVYQYAPEDLLMPNYRETGGHNMDGTWGKEVTRLKKLGWDISEFVREEEMAVAEQSGESGRMHDFDRVDKYVIAARKLSNDTFFIMKMSPEQWEVYKKKSMNGSTYTSETYFTFTNNKKYKNKPNTYSRGLGYLKSYDAVVKLFNDIEEACSRIDLP